MLNMQICPSLLFSFFHCNPGLLVCLLSLNTFSPEISWLILLTESHAFPSILIWEFALVYYFPFFHHNSGLLVVCNLSLNTFSPNIYWLILLTESHTFSSILIWEFALVYYFSFFDCKSGLFFVFSVWTLLVPRTLG